MERFQRFLPQPWSVLFFLAASSVYIYVFMEWVFFVTKPSFMSGMTIWLQLRIYLISALGLSVLPILIVITLSMINRIFRSDSINKILVWIGILIPSLIIASMILILIDNFTYTVFNFGIVSTERVSRAAYGFLFLVLLGLLHHKIKLYTLARGKKNHPVRRNQLILLFGFLSTSLILSLFSIFNNRTNTGFTPTDASTQESLPNIVLLGSDGLDATHLSVYEYERDTTPHITSLLPSALVAENAFPNGGTTAGSIASILTGKLPIETRVIYPPDILRDQDSYQHLPGILKRLGYRTVDLSVPYYGDALTLNMQGGFDIANERAGMDNFLLKLTRSLGGGDSAYFVDTMLQRISVRLLHIFFMRPMTNPFEVVIEPAERSNEQNRFNKLIALLDQAELPVFVHVHMLGTHGPRFEIRQQVFSAGQTQDKEWMIDFYDDAILTFDQYIGELFNYLSDSNQLNDTIVVVYSDHGMEWKVNQRIPLIFWFPAGAYAGSIQANVQNIDIVPTILDYLDVPVPKWIQGQSIIAQDVTGPKHVFSASVDSDLIEVTRDGLWAVEADRRTPPFYQLGYVGLVVCNQWYQLYVKNPSLHYGEVAGHTRPCDGVTLPTPEQAKQILLDHLFQYGYDTSNFPGLTPVVPFE